MTTENRDSGLLDPGLLEMPLPPPTKLLVTGLDKNVAYICLVY
jgi:hypothetical protein